MNKTLYTQIVSRAHTQIVLLQILQVKLAVTHSASYLT